MKNANFKTLKHESFQFTYQLSFGKTFLYFIPISIILVFFLFNSCQTLRKFGDKAKALSKCKFEIISIDKKVSFKEPTANIWNYVIQVNIAAINPNSENITLGRYKLSLYANNKWITDIATKVPISLKANDTTIIAVKTIISPSGVLSIFWKKLVHKKIEYKISGTFYLILGDFTLPIEVQLFKLVDNPN